MPSTVYRAAVGSEDAGDALQQGALARPVVADERHRRAVLDSGRDAGERLELAVAGSATVQQRRLEALVAFVVEPESLVDVVDLDSERHSSSAILGSRRRKTSAPTTMEAIAEIAIAAKRLAGGIRRS